MPAKIIDGKKVAEKIYKKLNDDIFDLNEQLIEPGLAIVQVGNDPASEVYVGKKIEKAKELGLFAKRVPVTASVFFEKDVDGFSSINQGRLFAGNPYFIPATPKGIIELIKSTGTKVAGKNVVVVGRSNIVGKPIAM